MGHALNATILDILTRLARMQGRTTLLVPGTDHAGIATQNVVEKELQKEGKTRFDLGREAFIKRVWQWKEKYGSLIATQYKKLGCSCDWSRFRFTMDQDYSTVVRKAFEYYYRKGYVYQGSRVINWCPRCQTALSDIELEHKQVKDKLWFIKYPLKDSSEQIVVATTRPETMLGDTAVAVHPKDKRYQHLVGQMVILPLAKREIPIIADPMVDPDFGTGAVKVTPGHDPNDFELGERHHLPKIKVFDESNTIIYPLKAYFRLNFNQARKKILSDLNKAGLIAKTQDYLHSVPFCSRCNTKVEQLLSKQWFLKMEKLSKAACKVVLEGRVKFIPKRFEKVYFDWMNNLKDWCISRQIWWGHRLPVWQAKDEGSIYVGENPPPGYKQIDDVFDTWFSSALWPFAVFLKSTTPSSSRKKAWLKKVAEIFGQELISSDLVNFYPTSVLSTAREIIFLWVARMIFSGLEFTSHVPFSVVFVHPLILTQSGQKMSKSKGTGIDPLVLIDKYGTDALRFGLAWQLTGMQDLKFKEDTIVAARNFCNKIWNSARFVLINHPSQSEKETPKPITKADKRILSLLNKITRSITKDITEFRFGRAAQTLYHFFWHEFCDKYIEESKIQMKNNSLRDNTQKILVYVLSSSLKLLHPFMPFITEEIWQKLKQKEPLIVSSWPT